MYRTIIIIFLFQFISALRLCFFLKVGIELKNRHTFHRRTRVRCYQSVRVLVLAVDHKTRTDNEYSTCSSAGRPERRIVQIFSPTDCRNHTYIEYPIVGFRQLTRTDLQKFNVSWSKAHYSVGIAVGLEGSTPQFMCPTPQFLLFVCLGGSDITPLVRLHRKFCFAQLR